MNRSIFSNSFQRLWGSWSVSMIVKSHLFWKSELGFHFDRGTGGDLKESLITTVVMKRRVKMVAMRWRWQNRCTPWWWDVMIFWRSSKLRFNTLTGNGETEAKSIVPVWWAPSGKDCGCWSKILFFKKKYYGCWSRMCFINMTHHKSPPPACSPSLDCSSYR